MILGYLMNMLAKRLPTLLRQRRNGNSKELAVRSRVDPQVRGAQSLVDRGENRNVPRLDGDERRFGDMERSDLVERRGGAVIVDNNVIEQMDRGAAGSDRGQILPQVPDRLVHAAASFVKDGFDHGSVPCGFSASSRSELQLRISPVT